MECQAVGMRDPLIWAILRTIVVSQAEMRHTWPLLKIGTPGGIDHAGSGAGSM